MIILGIDPGYATIGYGVVNYENSRFIPLEFGAITTPAKTDFSKRLLMIKNGIEEIIDRHSVDAAAIEKLFFNTNTTTAIDVAQARGVIVCTLASFGIPVYEYTPLQVKQSVTGYGRAEKKQVMEMTRIILNLKTVPKPDDTADALALAVCHGHCAGSVLGRIEKMGCN